MGDVMDLCVFMSLYSKARIGCTGTGTRQVSRKYGAYVVTSPSHNLLDSDVLPTRTGCPPNGEDSTLEGRTRLINYVKY